MSIFKLKKSKIILFSSALFAAALGFSASYVAGETVWTKVGVPTYESTDTDIILKGAFSSLQAFNASGTELVWGTDYRYGSNNESLDKLGDLNYETKLCLTGKVGDVSTNILNDGSKIVLTFTAEEASGWRSRLPITKYSVTTANDAAYRDPDDWVIYGSKDGTEWTQIASVTNAALPGGNVKEEDRWIQYDFPVDVVANFSQFKFEFTGNVGSDTQFQIADLVVWTENPESTPDFTSKPDRGRNYVPLTLKGYDVWKDGESISSGSSTWYFGTNEVAEKLLDMEIASENDTKVKTCMVSTDGNFFEKFDSVTFDFQGNQQYEKNLDGTNLNIPETIYKRMLTAYSITTANDAINRTPDSWVLYGSNDNKNWTVIDTIEGAALSKLNTMFTIPLEEAVETSAFYRLEITDSIANDKAMQLSEFTLWDAASTEEIAKLPTAKSITVAERGELNSTHYESVAKLQDGKSDKYLGYFDTAKSKDEAVQLSEDNPLSIVFEMDDAYLLEAYSFTTANDRSERDASDWRIYGSDNGESWTLLGEVADFTMTEERNATQLFNLDGDVGYGYFRFDFLGTRDLTNGFQLAELTLYGSQYREVPEPASIVLLGLGVLGIFSVRRIRGRSKK